MAGKFEIYKDRAGKFPFRLKASNGEIIAVSRRITPRLQRWVALSLSARTHRTQRLTIKLCRTFVSR